MVFGGDWRWTTPNNQLKTRGRAGRGAQSDQFWGDQVGRRSKNWIQSMSVLINFFLSQFILQQSPRTVHREEVAARGWLKMTYFFAKSFFIGTLRKVYSRTHSSISFEYRQGCTKIQERSRKEGFPYPWALLIIVTYQKRFLQPAKSITPPTSYHFASF